MPTIASSINSLAEIPPTTTGKASASTPPSIIRSSINCRAIIKQFSDVASIRQLFQNRKNAEQYLITSHGEAGKYFVSFLDNHDQYQRFNTPTTPAAQVLMGVAVLFCLQDIPCLYYGTEQGLTGAINPDGTPASGSLECVREALWGKTPVAFDRNNPLYT